MEPVWDEKKRVYYCLSFQINFDENVEVQEGDFLPAGTGSEVYLSVLDKDLHLIAEGAVFSLDRKPSFHFAKDGKLWLFKNMENEMGFVKLDITW